jgi:ectoine hydroxylase-related dioxygenase (phytanoyl-CoA dioxygenase family)
MIEPYISDLKTHGFTVIRSLVDVELLRLLLQEINSGRVSTGDGKEVPRLNRGSDIIYNPFFHDMRFFELFRNETIDSILQYFFNDSYYKGLDGFPNYILRSMICRSSKEKLPWHLDSFIPFIGDFPSTFQVVIPLEEFKADTGPTLLYPGSHQNGGYAPQDLEHSPGVIELSAQVGDVIIWDARIWHAAKANETAATRWAAIATFTRWWIKQNYRYTEIVKNIHGLEGYSDADLVILGAASETPLSHMESVDLKGGKERISKVREL